MHNTHTHTYTYIFFAVLALVLIVVLYYYLKPSINETIIVEYLKYYNNVIKVLETSINDATILSPEVKKEFLAVSLKSKDDINKPDNRKQMLDMMKESPNNQALYDNFVFLVNKIKEGINIGYNVILTDKNKEDLKKMHDDFVEKIKKMLLQ